MTKEKVMVALGGNAILKHGEEGTIEDQTKHIENTCKHLTKLIQEGYHIVITHGNGPQVGDILLKNDLSKDTLPPMPLDVCGAQSQGMIGYLMQQNLDNALKKVGMHYNVVTILTQTIISKNDPDFKNPSKPIGPYYTAMQASNLRKEKGWMLTNDSGKGYRRVVPSPEPIGLVEEQALKQLFDENFIIIACGGGGVPVIREEDKDMRGVEAVIDKDHTAALFAKILKTDILLILTDVEKVAINYKKPSQKNLDTITVADAEKYLSEGQFPKGSMGPKVESAIRFVKSGGKKAIITSLEMAVSGLAGKTGTIILP